MSEEQYNALMEAQAAIAETVNSAMERIEELAEKVDGMEAFIQETHYGFMMIALGDEQIRANFEDEGIQEEMLGELAILGGDEEGED